MAHRRHGIRANLGANREARAGYKRRVTNEAFGIYRPLTTESMEQVWDVVGKARTDIKEYLGKNRHSAADIAVPYEMGVTFLPKIVVGRAMRRGALHHTLGAASVGQMIARVEAKAAEEPSLEVPLDVTDWFSYEERKLVYLFDPNSAASDELNIQAGFVQDLLAYHKAGEILCAEQPNHVTLLQYGKAKDGRALNYDQKHDVGQIMESHFTAANLGSISLGPMIIGNGYTQPKSAT